MAARVRGAAPARQRRRASSASAWPLVRHGPEGRRPELAGKCRSVSRCCARSPSLAKKLRRPPLSPECAFPSYSFVVEWRQQSPCKPRESWSLSFSCASAVRCIEIVTGRRLSEENPSGVMTWAIASTPSHCRFGKSDDKVFHIRYTFCSFDAVILQSFLKSGLTSMVYGPAQALARTML